MAKSAPISAASCPALAESIIPIALQTHLKAMCKLRRRALEWSDPEGVHAMRVSSRRLRSAMSDFRPFVHARLPRVKLRRIADALGAVRDLDVALIALDGLSKQAKGEAATGIQIIADESRARRKDARAKLKNAIRPAVIDEFRNEFQAGLKDLRLSKRSAAKLGALPVTLRDVGRQIIVERTREVRAASLHLYFPFHIKELHELRILTKRLRYAVELFGECWRPSLRGAAKEISLLQTSLGELHDCDVWLEALSSRFKDGERKHHRDERDARVRAGATWLLRHFAAARMVHYRAAVARWQEWTASNFLDKLDSVIAGSPDKPQARGTPKV